MAGKGGKRPGAGRKKRAEIPEVVAKGVAQEILDFIALKENPHKDCHCLKCRWRKLAENKDARLQFNVEESLLNRVVGRAMQNVNHIHDKPLEMNVNISMAEVVRKARQRAEQYERNRKS